MASSEDAKAPLLPGFGDAGRDEPHRGPAQVFAELVDLVGRGQFREAIRTRRELSRMGWDVIHRPSVRVRSSSHP